MLDPATLGEVHRFHETYSAWTGRAWLRVVGPTPAKVQIGPGYGALRRTLRRRWPDRPFDTEWADGRFAPAPFGWPAVPVVAVALVAGVAGVAGAAAVAGTTGAVVVATASAWPIARLLDGVEATGRGLRVGPPWAPRVPWFHVQEVGIVGSTVWVRSARGAASGTVPPVLVPAVRARIRRLSGLDPVDHDGGTTLRYARWRAAASGIPWGVGLATLVGAWSAPGPVQSSSSGLRDPWAVLTAGGLVTVGLVLLGAAVEARATGWGTGAVGLLTLLYALVALLLGFATV